MTITIKDIDEAFQKWRSEQHGLGDSFWMSVAHADYPLGIDVQIEYVDDPESKYHNRPWAWVYPNVEQKTDSGDVWLTTDTLSCLAGFELPYHPDTEPAGRVLFRYTEADVKRAVWSWLSEEDENDDDPDLNNPDVCARFNRLVAAMTEWVEKNGPPHPDAYFLLASLDKQPAPVVC